MIIIGFVAEMAGGKTAATDYVVNKYGAKRYSFSTIFHDLLERLHLPLVRENFANISLVLRQTFGQDLFAKTMVEDIKLTEGNRLILVDSIRREEDIVYLKQLPNWHLIALRSSMETRYQRLTSRREKSDDAVKTYEQFVKDHELDTEKTIVPLLDKADIQIENEGTMEELYEKIDKVINELIQKEK